MARPSSPWQTFSLHFRQKYERGYRYLDHCGAFMVEAENELGFIPGDAKPIGAKLYHPDHGVNLEVDSTGLTMKQDNPKDSGVAFLNLSIMTSSLAQRHFEPDLIYYAGFAIQRYREYPSEEQLFAASLGFGSPYYNELGSKLGLTPSHQSLSYAFSSGSYEFQADLRPVTLNSTRGDVSKSYPFRATANQRRNVDRWNAQQRSMKPFSGFALLLEADLREYNPPEHQGVIHFESLMKLLEQLEESFSLAS